jgi:cation transport ATPase
MPRQVDFLIRGMTCAACAARVERKLNALDSVRATVNFATERATVSAPASVPVQRLIEAVEQAGYGAEALSGTAAGTGGSGPAGAAGGRADAERVVYLRNRLIVALVFFIPLSDLSVLWSLFPSFRLRRFGAPARRLRPQPHRAAPAPADPADRPGRDTVPADGPEQVQPEEQVA